MIISINLVSAAILFFAGIAQCTLKDEKQSELVSGKRTFKNDTLQFLKQSDSSGTSPLRKIKYSSRIAGSRFVTEKVFGIRTFPASKSNLVKEVAPIKDNITLTTDNVLDFRIEDSKKTSDKDKSRGKNKKNKKKDMVTAPAGEGKQKKEADDEEEKTLAQQVADGKYGLIQNEIFANGSKRPGIVSYLSNVEVPKDTKDNLGGLEKDEIWLAEDHILVLRGGNYQTLKENEIPSKQVWPPIDNYKAPNRQVKIPKNPEVPPPFPVQLTEDGPVEFIKGQREPPAIPPIIPSLPPFEQESNKTIHLPFIVPNSPFPPSASKNKTFPFPVPPHLLPPFLSNLPPGATFVAPPDNQTGIDEDDPSIYYPPRYDFHYPLDNTTAVPPGPLVPGIILPPPPDFFSLLENNATTNADYYKDHDDSINAVTPNVFQGPKYLPAIRKPVVSRVSTHREIKRPLTVSDKTENKKAMELTPKPIKPNVAYVYPENSKPKSMTTTTTTTTTTKPPKQFFLTNIKTQNNKYLNDFSAPIFVPNNPQQPEYHPLPTTSPKPNHITLPTTKTLPKQIFIITTPETVDKNRIEEVYKKSKQTDAYKYELINPEIHPLRSLIKPNVTVSYNGKYGHLPTATVFPFEKTEKGDSKKIQVNFIPQLPVTKATKTPSTDINSITVTPIPVIKKIRVLTVPTEKPKAVIPPANSSKATLYFYEEPSTTEFTSPAQKPEKPIPSFPSQIGINLPGKKEEKPLAQNYYNAKSTSKTPIRQYLEETFHSSNVLPRKPQIAHINNAEIITHSSYSETPKMKHLNYGTHVSPKPAIKYHYVTDENAVIISSPKIKDLEIKNSGSSGLQNVNLDKVEIRPPRKPFIVQSANESAHKPETQNSRNSHVTSNTETPGPTLQKSNDGPFIPSNYFATIRPELVHFTSQEQTLVDDITKNYFTIFGQKINSVSTTPLTPVKSTVHKTKDKTESGLTYLSNNGQNFKIQQVHETSGGRHPGKSTSVFYIDEKPVDSNTPRPPSNFEKYLKELTGEDQKDYVISGVFPAKVKKGKGFLEAEPGVGKIPSHLLSQGPVIFQNGHPTLHQISSTKNSDQGIVQRKIPYRPNFSTTLRPVDVEIKPQYVQHIHSTSNPLTIYPHAQPQNLHVSHNFQQYLQEVTGLTSPTTTNPVKIKIPNLQYFPTTASPLKPIGFQHTPFQVPQATPKPVSLEGDILVNYKHPRPVINPEAELINLNNPLPFDLSPNIKIVDSPDLSKTPNHPYSTKQITFGTAKDIFENLPKSGYFSPPHQTGGNSFVSYNLPGNGGHFYFLTPQIVQKETEEGVNRKKDFPRINRSGERGTRTSRGTQVGSYSSEVEHNIDEGYSNLDYLRRRRKKS